MAQLDNPESAELQIKAAELDPLNASPNRYWSEDELKSVYPDGLWTHNNTIEGDTLPSILAEIDEVVCTTGSQYLMKFDENGKLVGISPSPELIGTSYFYLKESKTQRSLAQGLSHQLYMGFTTGLSIGTLEVHKDLNIDQIKEMYPVHTNDPAYKKGFNLGIIHYYENRKIVEVEKKKPYNEVLLVDFTQYRKNPSEGYLACHAEGVALAEQVVIPALNDKNTVGRILALNLNGITITLPPDPFSALQLILENARNKKFEYEPNGYLLQGFITRLELELTAQYETQLLESQVLALNSVSVKFMNNGLMCIRSGNVVKDGAGYKLVVSNGSDLSAAEIKLDLQQLKEIQHTDGLKIESGLINIDSEDHQLDLQFAILSSIRTIQIVYDVYGKIETRSALIVRDDNDLYVNVFNTDGTNSGALFRLPPEKYASVLKYQKYDYIVN